MRQAEPDDCPDPRARAQYSLVYSLTVHKSATFTAEVSGPDVPGPARPASSHTDTNPHEAAFEFFLSESLSLFCMPERPCVSAWLLYGVTVVWGVMAPVPGLLTD